MITQNLGKRFLFHSNLDVNPKQINHFPQYYQEIFRKIQQPIGVAQYPIYNNFTSYLIQ